MRHASLLTSPSLITPHLTADNAESLIAKAAGKSRREIEAHLATLAPKELFKPSVRRQSQRDRKKIQELPETLPLDEAQDEKRTAAPAERSSACNLLEPADGEHYIRFSAGKAFTEKLDRLAEVLGIECPRAHIERILDTALEAALEKKDPQRKLERRRRRNAKKPKPCPGDADTRTAASQKASPRRETSRNGAEEQAVSRYISSEVKERILEKAGYQYEFRGTDGVRCACRTGLEVDHMKPFAVFGSHDERFLRALCPAHNILTAEQYCGREFTHYGRSCRPEWDPDPERGGARASPRR